MSTSCPRHQSFRFVLTMALTFSLAAAALPRPQHAASPQASGTAEVGANLPPKAPARADAETEQRARKAYGKLGVSFEENRGQADERVRFLSRRGGATVFLTNDKASFVLSARAQKGAGTTASRDSASDERPSDDAQAAEALAPRGRGPATREKPKFHAVHMKYEGANPWAEVIGERELEGKVNYLRGDDPSKWQTDVKTFGAVRYRGIYDGIDLVYYGNE